MSRNTTIASVFALTKKGLNQHEIFRKDDRNSLQFLHPSESDPVNPPRFYRAITNDTGTDDQIATILVEKISEMLGKINGE